MRKRRIDEIVSDNGGFISAAMLREQGSYYRALRAVKKGDLVKVGFAVYATPDALLTNMIDVEIIVPKGIVCMFSAWTFYALTTVVAPAVCLAIEAKRKVVVPDIIPINIYYWKQANLEFGITEVDYSGYKVRITDIERSVCDAVKYRNKIGPDLTAEIVKNYLKRPTRNISRLVNYAKRLRVSSVICNYLEIYM